MVSTEAAQVTAVSEGEGGLGKSEVKVPDGRGEKRDVGGKERDVGGEREPGNAVEAAEAKEDVGEIFLKLGVIRPTASTLLKRAGVKRDIRTSLERTTACNHV